MTATVDRPEAVAAGSEGTAETVDAPVPASVRVYMLAARKSLIPLTLPAEAPLGKVVEATVKVVNNRLTGGDALPDRVVYEFGWIDGAVLSDRPDTTLASCGVRDGDLLQLLPAGTADPLRAAQRERGLSAGHLPAQRGQPGDRSDRAHSGN